MGYSRKNPNRGRALGVEDIESLVIYIKEKARGNSSNQSKKKQNFQGYLIKNGGISMGLGFGTWIGISKWCHTILQNFSRWKHVFSVISKAKSQI